MANPQPDYSMFIDDYKKDTQVCFKEIRSSIIDLKKDPTNDEKFILIQGVFHSIKGSSRLLGFNDVENFARASKERIKQIQAAPVTNVALDELSKLTDKLEEMVRSHVKNPDKPDAAAVTEEKLPDKLALFTIENRQYALPLDAIERVIRAVEVTPLPKAPENVLGANSILKTSIQPALLLLSGIKVQYLMGVVHEEV